MDVFLDLSILLKTIPAVFRRRGRVLAAHDEIWRQLPDGRHATPELHERVLQALETRLHDAGRGEGGCSTSGAATGRWRHGWRDRAPGRGGRSLARRRSNGPARATPTSTGPRPAADGRLPVPDASFDVVTCVNVLQHVADTQTLLSEAAPGARLGGLLIVTVPCHGRFQGACHSADLFERHFDPLEPVLRFYTARSLRALLEAFAFEHVEAHAHGGAPLMRRTLLAIGRRAGIAAPA